MTKIISLPHQFRPIGIGIALIGIGLGILGALNNFSNTLMNTASLSIAIGLWIVFMAKEKNQDERIIRLKLLALCYGILFTGLGVLNILNVFLSFLNNESGEFLFRIDFNFIFSPHIFPILMVANLITYAVFKRKHSEKFDKKRLFLTPYPFQYIGAFMVLVGIAIQFFDPTKHSIGNLMILHGLWIIFNAEEEHKDERTFALKLKAMFYAYNIVLPIFLIVEIVFFFINNPVQINAFLPLSLILLLASIFYYILKRR